MTWLEFIARTIEALAWPAVVVFLALTFREKLAELLKGLRRFKHKDTEIEFERGVAELKKDVEDVVEKEAAIRKDNPEEESQYGFLLRLADFSPRSAVMEAWRLVESEAAKASVRREGEDSTGKNYGVLALRKMEKKLSPQDRRVMNELRTLRNMAAHEGDFSLRGMPIESYIDLALTMAAHFKRIEGEAKD